MAPSEIAGDGFQLRPVARVLGVEAMVHVVMDQSLLGVVDGAFDRLQLLRNVNARPPILNHTDDRTQVAFGAFQPGYDLGVACMCVGFRHTQWLTSLGGWRKASKARLEQDRAITEMRLVDVITRTGRRLLFSLACIALAVWTVSPTASHLPKIVETLQEHAEMIATHGHSHGLEEDLIWALHGHSHEAADHDHKQADFIQDRAQNVTIETRIYWHGIAIANGPPPSFRLDRPPRA